MPSTPLTYLSRNPDASSLAHKGPDLLMAGASPNAFETLAVIITRRGVQGDMWPLLELFKDKTEKPIQVIVDWRTARAVGLGSKDNL